MNINKRDQTTKIGPSYAIQVSDSVNVGITVYFHDRESELINNQFIRRADGTFEWSNLYFEAFETGIQPILGIMWTPSDVFSLGMSLRQTIILSSGTTSQSTCSSDINNPAIQATQCLPVPGSPIIDPGFSSSDIERELPINIRLGVAYFPTDKFLFDLDLSFYEAVKNSGINSTQTINIAAGFEYYYNASWAMRGGYFTNNANTPELSSSLINQLDHVDLNGISLSLTHFTKSSSVTGGFAYSWGEGKAQVITGSPQIQNLEQSIQTVYLSTSYSF